MKVYKVELLIVDHDNVGGAGIVEVLENQKYPNYCISPNVMDVESAEIGEWSDDHPLNKIDTIQDEYNRLFNIGDD